MLEGCIKIDDTFHSEAVETFEAELQAKEGQRFLQGEIMLPELSCLTASFNLVAARSTYLLMRVKIALSDATVIDTILSGSLKFNSRHGCSNNVWCISQQTNGSWRSFLCTLPAASAVCTCCAFFASNAEARWDEAFQEKVLKSRKPLVICFSRTEMSDPKLLKELSLWGKK